MSDYVVYHNCEAMGYSLSDREDRFTGNPPFRILTKKNVVGLKGSTIWLIEGRREEGQKLKTYYLCSKFVIENTWPDDEEDVNYAGAKRGADYRQKVRLNDYGEWFSEFKRKMANFSLGLQKIGQADVKKLKEIVRDLDAGIQTTGSHAVDDLADLPNIPDADFTGHDRLSVAKTRQGQQIFSDRVKRAYGYACAICGIDEQRFLNASHIIGWAEDRANRLNPANGLCLCVLHDRAFEAYYLTLDKQLRICVSRKVSRKSPLGTLLWAVHGQRIRTAMAHPPGEQFLAVHRQRLL